MKQQIKTSAALVVLAFALNFQAANAQTNVKKYKAEIASADNKTTPVAADGTLKETDVNIKVVRNFRKTFPLVEDAYWTEAKGFYFVHFTTDDIRQKIAYGKNGEISYEIKMFGANQVPQKIRRNVLTTYYDYTITSAQELKLNRQSVFLVKISGDRDWKTIRISDGEMEVIEEFRKG